MSYDAPERRAGAGRPVYSRGPIIRTLEVVNVIAAPCAVAGFIIALILLGSRIEAIQQSRQAAARDSCYVLRALVAHAYGHLHQADGATLLASVGLGDCDQYGRRIRRAR